MQHRIEQTKDRYVVGMKANMSIQTINQETGNLARQFMPRRHEISTRFGKHVFSIQDYGNLQIKDVTPQTTFEKWVGVEVVNFDVIPEGMEPFILKAGIYVAFTYKGSMQDFPKSRQYMFQDWLPNSKYLLDNRAHFEILSEDYSKNLQNIEEEVWIPIIEKYS
ncbi:GyrI-like domain-containing protein [Formosa maritima]|uniref:GyrI-like domain-containing protein n=1 Tax=Formosa maritima TaxID=2592046 RepID=A0A5D0G8G5_9FLAO|nr:GyrI-like domain-containing protein [Formosa maritima]TYA55124.1 GyrI-like domain-containing protein [Formosa maritima]